MTAEERAPHCRHERFWSRGKWWCRHCSATWDDALEWAEEYLKERLCEEHGHDGDDCDR